MKTLEEHIKSINVNEANFKHIAKYGNINGTLLSELRRVMADYARQCVHKALEEAAETNFETYRILSDAAINEESEHNHKKLKYQAAGYKYAAKQTLSLKEKY